MQNPITLVAGRKYKDREGHIVEVSTHHDSKYQFSGNTGRTYMPNGVWRDGDRNPQDLIEEVLDNPPVNAHKHAELISMWAYDTTLKFQWLDSRSTWRDCVDGPPTWNPNTSYRVKPVVVKQILYCQCKPSHIGDRTEVEYPLDNLKLTFTDGVLTQAEVV